MFRHSELVKEMDSLRKFALRLTGNVHDADDLLQTTILKALEKQHQFQDGSNLFGWTSKIMFRQFVSDYRRRIKFESKYDPTHYIEKMYISSSQEEKITFSETCVALNHLPYKHRQIIIMTCIHGMKYKTVANELGIPVGTVRSRLSRARTALQNQMENRSMHSIHRFQQSKASP